MVDCSRRRLLDYFGLKFVSSSVLCLFGLLCSAVAILAIEFLYFLLLLWLVVLYFGELYCVLGFLIWDLFFLCKLVAALFVH